MDLKYENGVLTKESINHIMYTEQYERDSMIIKKLITSHEIMRERLLALQYQLENKNPDIHKDKKE